MRITGYLCGALLAAATFGGGGAASAANMCHAGKMTCATAMPVDGYCECTAHGATESGTVVSSGKPAPRHQANSTAGGCGAHPTAPGCS